MAPPAGLVQKKAAGGSFFQTMSAKVRVLCARLCLAHKTTHDADRREAEPATTCINKFAAKTSN